MKRPIALGILASMAPSVLEATLSHWAGETCNVYVHLDAKYSSEPFRFIENFPNVTLIPNRVGVYWGGFSLVEAELELMKAAAAHGFDYFMLISDDTVPLLAADALVAHLSSPSAWKPIGTTDQPHIRARYDHFYCADMHVSNPRTQRLEYDAADREILLDLHCAMRAGKVPLPGLFWNANWKALTHEDVAFVLDHALEKGSLYSSFRFSLNPDEHYIPTILGRRPQGALRVERFIWADFSKEPKPYVLGRPEDFDDPVSQGYWFARKVHDPEVARQAMLRSSVSGTRDGSSEKPGPGRRPNF